MLRFWRGRTSLDNNSPGPTAAVQVPFSFRNGAADDPRFLRDATDLLQANPAECFPPGRRRQALLDLRELLADLRRQARLWALSCAPDAEANAPDDTAKQPALESDPGVGDTFPAAEALAFLAALFASIAVVCSTPHGAAASPSAGSPSLDSSDGDLDSLFLETSQDIIELLVILVRDPDSAWTVVRSCSSGLLFFDCLAVPNVNLQLEALVLLEKLLSSDRAHEASFSTVQMIEVSAAGAISLPPSPTVETIARFVGDALVRAPHAAASLVRIFTRPGQILAESLEPSLEPSPEPALAEESLERVEQLTAVLRNSALGVILSLFSESVEARTLFTFEDFAEVLLDAAEPEQRELPGEAGFRGRGSGLAGVTTFKVKCLVALFRLLQSETAQRHFLETGFVPRLLGLFDRLLDCTPSDGMGEAHQAGRIQLAEALFVVNCLFHALLSSRFPFENRVYEPLVASVVRSVCSTIGSLKTQDSETLVRAIVDRGTAVLKLVATLVEAAEDAASLALDVFLPGDDAASPLHALVAEILTVRANLSERLRIFDSARAIFERFRVVQDRFLGSTTPDVTAGGSPSGEVSDENKPGALAAETRNSNGGRAVVRTLSSFREAPLDTVIFALWLVGAVFWQNDAACEMAWTVPVRLSGGRATLADLLTEMFAELLQNRGACGQARVLQIPVLQLCAVWASAGSRNVHNLVHSRVRFIPALLRKCCITFRVVSPHVLHADLVRQGDAEARISDSSVQPSQPPEWSALAPGFVNPALVRGHAAAVLAAMLRAGPPVLLATLISSVEREVGVDGVVGAVNGLISSPEFERAQRRARRGEGAVDLLFFPAFFGLAEKTRAGLQEYLVQLYLETESMRVLSAAGAGGGVSVKGGGGHNGASGSGNAPGAADGAARDGAAPGAAAPGGASAGDAHYRGLLQVQDKELARLRAQLAAAEAKLHAHEARAALGDAGGESAPDLMRQREVLRAEVLRLRAENAGLRAERVEAETLWAREREAYRRRVRELRADLAAVARMVDGGGGDGMEAAFDPARFSPSALTLLELVETVAAEVPEAARFFEGLQRRMLLEEEGTKAAPQAAPKPKAAAAGAKATAAGVKATAPGAKAAAPEAAARTPAAPPEVPAAAPEAPAAVLAAAVLAAASVPRESPAALRATPPPTAAAAAALSAGAAAFPARDPHPGFGVESGSEVGGADGAGVASSGPGLGGRQARWRLSDDAVGGGAGNGVGSSAAAGEAVFVAGAGSAAGGAGSGATIAPEPDAAQKAVTGAPSLSKPVLHRDALFMDSRVANIAAEGSGSAGGGVGGGFGDSVGFAGSGGFGREGDSAGDLSAGLAAPSPRPFAGAPSQRPPSGVSVLSRALFAAGAAAASPSSSEAGTAGAGGGDGSGARKSQTPGAAPAPPPAAAASPAAPAPPAAPLAAPLAAVAADAALAEEPSDTPPREMGPAAAGAGARTPDVPFFPAQLSAAPPAPPAVAPPAPPLAPPLSAPPSAVPPSFRLRAFPPPVSAAASGGSGPGGGWTAAGGWRAPAAPPPAAPLRPQPPHMAPPPPPAARGPPSAAGPPRGASDARLERLAQLRERFRIPTHPAAAGAGGGDAAALGGGEGGACGRSGGVSAAEAFGFAGGPAGGPAAGFPGPVPSFGGSAGGPAAGEAAGGGGGLASFRWLSPG